MQKPKTVPGKWSYSGNPAHSAKDQTRFLVGDTNIQDQLLSDEEIIWALSQYNNTPMNAAIRLCETIMSKFSRLADESVGQVKISFSQKVKGYERMMTTLRSRLAMEDAQPFAGGILVSQKQVEAQNTNRVRPDFTKHMMENDQIAPWVTTSAYGLWLAFQD